MGFAVEIRYDDNLAIDHYKFKTGRAVLFGGGPVVEGDTSFLADPATSRVIMDPNYRINEDGTLRAWSFFQAEKDLSKTNYPIGYIKLVILREDGADYIVVGVAEQTRDIIGPGLWEFPCEIAVQRNDIVAFWVLANTTLLVSGQTDLEPPANLIRRFDSTGPEVDDNLGSGTVVVGNVLYSVAVRSEIEDTTIIDVDAIWQATDVNNDTYSYVDFASGTDAFPESNITNPANAFDEDKATYASVATGISTLNAIYYFLGTDAATLLPLERYIIRGLLGTGGGAKVQVYGSQDTTQTYPPDLTKAQAVVDWEMLAEYTADTTLNVDAMFHVARKYKWLKVVLTPGATTGTRLHAFEVEIMEEQVADGLCDPYPQLISPLHDPLKSRYFFDEDSFQQGTQRSALLTDDLSSTGKILHLDAAEDEFFDQLVIGGFVYVRRNVVRGSTNVMVRGTIAGKDPLAKTVTLLTALNEAFNIGDYVDPEVWFVKALGYDATDRLFAASNWLGGHSTQDRWMRTHDVYVEEGN